MVPNRNPNLIRTQNPKFRAAPENNLVVIQNGRNNQAPVENPSHQDSILELGELVAEPTVGGVPEEFLPRSRCLEGSALRELGLQR